MSKFKINDIIIGNEKNTYPITNRKTLCKVIDTYATKLILVEVLDGCYKGNTHTVKEDAFDKVDKVENYKFIKISCIDNKTIEARYDDTVKDTHAVGIAKCHPEDKFDYLTGVKIAMERLYNEIEKVEIKKFNGKIVCVESPYSWFTVGKIYDVVDGVFYADDGDMYPENGYYIDSDDIKHAGCGIDAKHSLKNTFIPIVE